MNTKKKRNVIFDFDGVIHSYKSGWKGADVVADEPVPGVNEEIQRIREHYRVVVVSTRCYQAGGIEAIIEWLDRHNIVVDDVTSEKPPAVVSIDDRAINFNGSSDDLLQRIQNFKPWNQKDLSFSEETIHRWKENGIYPYMLNFINSIKDVPAEKTPVFIDEISKIMDEKEKIRALQSLKAHICLKSIYERFKDFFTNTR